MEVFDSCTKIRGVLSEMAKSCVAPLAQYAPDPPGFVIVVYVDELRVLCQKLPAIFALPAAALQESPILTGRDAVAATYGSLTCLSTLLRCILVSSAALFTADLAVGIQTIASARKRAELARGFALPTIRADFVRKDSGPLLLSRFPLALAWHSRQRDDRPSLALLFRIFPPLLAHRHAVIGVGYYIDMP